MVNLQLPKNSSPKDFEVAEEGAVVVVLEVHSDFVGKDDGVVVVEWVFLLGEDCFFVGVFDAGFAGEAGFEFEDFTGFALELIVITGDVGTRTYKGHVTN